MVKGKGRGKRVGVRHAGLSVVRDLCDLVDGYEKEESLAAPENEEGRVAHTQRGSRDNAPHTETGRKAGRWSRTGAHAAARCSEGHSKGEWHGKEGHVHAGDSIMAAVSGMEEIV